MIVNRSVPRSAVVPVLTYDDVAEVSDWLCRAFGFKERLRIGDHRAQLVFGDGAVIVTAGRTERRVAASPVTHAVQCASTTPTATTNKPSDLVRGSFSRRPTTHTGSGGTALSI
ncbi:MAG: hypothetical protein AABM40_10205 [Chloroflexota bacterium]